MAKEVGVAQVVTMGWLKPPKDEDDEKDETPPKPPKEPDGFDLTERRKRQRHSREWAAKTWDTIAQGLHDEQRKQVYVNEPKGRKRRADGN